ncbi:dienelactone hydrolase family protein [Dechloromonas agitata]|uniref:Dienelactone hydrolase family protein n=1 Tax=Dechloromonas agitata TaxID=73030 RepID=A0A930BT69_9RHOO|nr:dienelactone hydrolase family protein [Dechloromonas agitata]MBF1164811.1 dienelactone hydrolase family protein [Dechloromonas agitata]MDE1545910.1 dienelactone hydrolase family protein [Dechloromonas agitata]
MKTEPEFDSLVPAQSFDRRSFLATSLGVGFAVATQPVIAQTAIRTDEIGLLAGEIKVPVKDGELVAYRAAPGGLSKPPVILVVSEIFGAHEYIRDTCRRLAKLGYCAIAPDLFARQGDPRQIASIPEILEKITNKTPDAQVMSDLDACVAWAAAQGADTRRLAVTGFCWGGRITWLYCAHNPAVKAGVAWYGRLVGTVNAVTPKHPTELVGELKAPVLGLYGGLDTGIPLETVEAMEQALQQGSAAAKASEIHVYDNAPHAFHADYRPSYRKAEAEDGWQRMLAWFRKNGV